MSTARVWTRGYARQARADLDTWHRLQQIHFVPECHKLLFLQMACEKVAKAHLCASGTDPNHLQASHAYITKSLPTAIRQHIVELRLRHDAALHLLRHSRHLAQEIEMLAPAVRRGGQRPDNCEYPWEDEMDRLHVPLDWAFVPSQLLTVSSGRTFIKLVRAAIDRLIQDTTDSDRPRMS